MMRTLVVASTCLPWMAHGRQLHQVSPGGSERHETLQALTKLLRASTAESAFNPSLSSRQVPAQTKPCGPKRLDVQMFDADCACRRDLSAKADPDFLKRTVMSLIILGAVSVPLEELGYPALRKEDKLTHIAGSDSSGKGRLFWVEERLRAAMPIQHLEIVDVTDGHAMDAFLQGSNRALDPHGLELRLTVVSSAFEGMKTLQKQRLVNDALQAELLDGTIHALPSLKTLTSQQWQSSTAMEQTGLRSAGCEDSRRSNFL